MTPRIKPTLCDVGPLYVVMFDGCDGPMASLDCGNPFRTLKGAKLARGKLGVLQQQGYYIVKFRPERLSARKGARR